MSSDLSYRPELDGLRAVAVTAVLLFHLSIPAFSGGYLGVDVFFVISGYLITRILVSDIQSGTFSFAQFYSRRAKRLFPALATTVLLTLLFGYLVLDPKNYERLGGASLHAILSISNFFFWGESGYFDSDAINKPLLHTWSLGVEEQFYLVWPATILLITKIFKPVVRPWSLLMLGVIGFSVGLVYASRDSVGAFYLVPFRLFEFTLGAIAVWIPTAQRKSTGDWLLVAGISVIVFSVLWLDESTLFPSVYTLLPCLGTVLVIVANSASIAKPLLTNPIAVRIGLVSYSLYLVHWPVIVFFRQLSTRELSIVDQGLLVVLIYLLAELSFRLVETPFRRRDFRLLSSPATIGFCFSSVCLVMVFISAMVWKQDGLPQRIENQFGYSLDATAEGSSETWDELVFLRDQSLRAETRKRILVVGDSQAGDFLNLLNASGWTDGAKVASRIVQVYCGTVLLDDIQRVEYLQTNSRIQNHRSAGDLISRCDNQWTALAEDDRIPEADIIFISNQWYEYQVAFLETTISQLQARTNAALVFVGSKSMLYSSGEIATKCTHDSTWTPHPCTTSVDSLNQYAWQFKDTEAWELNLQIKTAAESNGALFVDLQRLVCSPPGQTCRVYNSRGKPNYYDKSHFTPTATKLFGKLMSLELDKLLGTEK